MSPDDGGLGDNRILIQDFKGSERKNEAIGPPPPPPQEITMCQTYPILCSLERQELLVEAYRLDSMS